jgi:hypothetical protein
MWVIGHAADDTYFSVRQKNAIGVNTAVHAASALPAWFGSAKIDYFNTI